MSGPLANARHERFAQARAKGESATAAYATAGYKPCDRNAHRVSKIPKVEARVKELLGRAARRTELSVASVTETLIRIAEKGEALGEAPGLQAARSAMMDAAKLNGLVVNTTERIIRTPEERRERIAQLKEELAREREANARVH